MNEDDAPTVAALFDALSHPRRRALILLVALAPNEGVSLRTAAETLYAVEHGVTPTEAPTRPVTNLRTNLTRSHLETLKTAGILSHTREDRLMMGQTFGCALYMIAIAHVRGDH